MARSSAGRSATARWLEIPANFLRLFLGRPLVIGTSRKSFLGKLTGRDVTERVYATVATCVMAFERGATVFRVHDVAAVSDALKVTNATVAAWPKSPRTTTTTT